MKRQELKTVVLDIETYKELIIIGGYIPYQDRWVMWEISYRKNELDAAIKFLLEEPIDYYITFNGVNFDGQVLQYTLDNYEDWIEYSWKEICDKVYTFVQNLISNQNYEIQPPYKEYTMDIKQIDMFLILHMNNTNRRTSLKWCMFSMNEDIELMEVDHAKVGLTNDDIENTIYYWKNDIKATDTLYKYCTGECEHPDYKGKDKIQLRLDLIEEMKLPHTAINWNDVKIGAELNKKAYLELTGMTSQKLWDKIKARKTKTGFAFKECYPKYWEFETKEFQEFFTNVGKTRVNLNVKQEFPFKYKNTEYMFAKGGGHSNDKPRIIRPNSDQILRDADIASMYPWAIAKRGLYPTHLGPKWNEAYISNIQKRIEAKKAYKETKDKRWDSMQETYKLVLNGNFGRLIDKHDWQYDPFIGMCVTIGSQIDIFMLVEDLELAGIQVMSLNTDGVVVLMNKDQEETYKQVCEAWEKQVGNDTMGRLEYAEYELLVQTSVNDYLAIKKGTEDIKDRTKKKGDWLTSYEIHKNKSKSIVPIALEQYYVHGKGIEDTIRNYQEIWPYCIAKKASKDYYYQGVNRSTGKAIEYKKLIRYYCSEQGEKLYKVKNDNSEKTGPKISQCESDSEKQVVFNKPVMYENMKEYKLDYEYYIRAAKKLMYEVDPVLARDEKEKAQGKILLF